MSNKTVIHGVEIKTLRTFPDARGFFRELVRFNDPLFASDPPSANFAQLSHSKMARHTVKAWHYHHLQTDWWYVGLGAIHAVIYDLREESPTYQTKMEFIMGDKEGDGRAEEIVLKIPPGVAHGCRVLSDFAHLFYITDQTYNTDDEGRHPFNSPLVPHDWGDPSELIVVENDRRSFPPKNPRMPVK